uniref:Uncharacterized protein n=1 Tax=viral metagenome TaxID=1070528 RepID=A0A6M3M070_9ZZZZ
MGKFSISYTRKAQTQPYENVTITLTCEFDDDEISPDYAFKEVRDKVNLWLNNELKSMGLK